MWKAENARSTLLADRAKLDMAALQVLAVFCFLPLPGELDLEGTHARESIFLAQFTMPAWCLSFLYRPYSLNKSRRDFVVFSLISGYELLFICWHAPLLRGVQGEWFWHTPMLSPGMKETGVRIWGWLPVHACLLLLGLTGLRAAYRLKKKIL